MFFVLLTACNLLGVNGEKGNWASHIKQEFMSACQAERTDIITEAQMRQICSCSMKKIEAEYAPTELTSSKALKFAESAGGSCAMEVMNLK